MNYSLIFTKQARKDFDRVAAVPALKQKALEILTTLEDNPYKPPYEKLLDKDFVYSRRLNIQHRIVYNVCEKDKTIKILRMWTHYGDN